MISEGEAQPGLTPVELQVEVIQSVLGMIGQAQVPDVMHILGWGLARAGRSYGVRKTIWTDFGQEIAERLNAQGLRGFVVAPPMEKDSHLVEYRLEYNKFDVLNLSSYKNSYKPLREKRSRKEAVVAAMDRTGNLRLYHEDAVHSNGTRISSVVSDLMLIPQASWQGEEGGAMVVERVTRIYNHHPATK